MHEAVKQYAELYITTTKYYRGQMLSISFTTEPSCVSSLTFMVLAAPPAKLKLPEKSRNLMMGEVRGILFGYTRIL